MKASNEIICAVLTDLGKMRDKNEDNYIRAEKKDLAVVGVIDGVGGYEGGEIAAELCKKSIEQSFEQEGDWRLLAEKKLSAVTTKANNLIYDERLKNTQLSRMSCVMSFAVLDSAREVLHYAHVGDTRGYIYRNGELTKFTHDHSFVGYLEESGTIQEEDAMRHPRRNEISKLMGEKLFSEADDYIEIGNYSFYANDIVLFCSDGLTDLVRKSEIEKVLSQVASLDEKAQLLVDLANEMGGKDNITVALAQYSAQNRHIMEENEPYISIKPDEIAKENNIKHRWVRTLGRGLLLLLLGGIIGFVSNFKGINYWMRELSLVPDSISIIKNDSIKKSDTIQGKPNTIVKEQNGKIQESTNN